MSPYIAFWKDSIAHCAASSNLDGNREAKPGTRTLPFAYVCAFFFVLLFVMTHLNGFASLCDWSSLFYSRGAL